VFRPELLRQPHTDAATDTDWRRRFEALAESAHDERLRAYYAAGMVDGDTPLSAVPLMALDVETTGLDPVEDGIVSIGLVPMGLDRIRASASHHWILKPRVPLGEASVTIHGITDSQVLAAPDLKLVLAEVLQAMQGHVLVVHCRDIERQFLNGALRPRIGEGIAFPVIDTMELEARLHRNQPRGWLNWALGRHPPPVSIRLADSRRRYNLPRYRPHHALTDALASAELLQAQVAHRFSPDTPVRELWK
jgi:DNA polymerase-3 subunit epsilon